MAKIFKSETELAGAFDAMVDAMIALDREWTDEAAGDVRHDLCGAIAMLAAVPLRPDQRRAHGAYESLDEGLRDVARGAYLGVIDVGRGVQHAWNGRTAVPRVLEQATCAIDELLDALAPYVTAAETGLRRCLLDGELLEEVLASQAGVAGAPIQRAAPPNG